MLSLLAALIRLCLQVHAQVSGSGLCDLPRLDVRRPATLRKFAQEIRGKAPAILDGAVDADWPTSDWSFSKWQQELASMTLPRRRVLSVGKTGAVHTAEEVSGDQLFNASLRSEVDPWMVFSTSRQDAVVARFAALGAFRPPAALASVNKFPVLSIGALGDGLAYHQHEEAWLALLHGSKVWYLRRPEEQPRIVNRRVAAQALAEELGTIGCTQQAGEIVYFPEGWWHATYNIENSVSNLTVGVGGIGSLGRKEFQMLMDGNVTGLDMMLVQQGPVFRRWISTHGVSVGAASGHAEVLRWLLDHSPRSSWDTLPLFQKAAEQGHTSTAALLLSYRAHVDGRAHKRSMKSAGHGSTEKMWTPMHYAAENGHKNMMQWLLRHRADVNIRDTDELQPLHVAANSGHVDATSWLLMHDHPEARSRTPKANLAFAAAADGHLELLSYLNENDYNFDRQDVMTTWVDPLHCAIANGHGEVVEWLFQQGIIERLHVNSNTPVQWTTQDGRIDALTVTVESSSHVNEGTLPLHYAGLYSREGVSAWIMKDGVRVCSADSERQATIHAIAINSQAVLSLLLQSPAAEEKRIDPEDGAARTLCQLRADVPPGEYSDQEIEDYWQTMQVVPSDPDHSSMKHMEADGEQHAKALLWLRKHADAHVTPSDPRVASQLGHSRIIEWLLRSSRHWRAEL